MKGSKKYFKLRKKDKSNIYVAILIFVIYFGVLIFLYSHKLVRVIKYGKASEDVIKEINEVSKENQEVEDYMFLKIQDLFLENNDLVGYLIIPDTTINIPVMYTKSDYYINRSFQKIYSRFGTPFIDKYNNIEPRDYNLIIYGHHNHNHNVFSDLDYYLDEYFYENHKTFTYYTLIEKEEYEIIAVFLSKVYYVTDKVFKYYKFYNANNIDEVKYYEDNIKKLSIYNIDFNLNLDDKLITLSTCNNVEQNGRLVVIGKLIK